MFEIGLGEGDYVIATAFKDMVNIKISGSCFQGSGGLMGSHGTGVMLVRKGSTVLEDPVMFGQEWQTRPDEDGPPLFHMKPDPQHPESACCHPLKMQLSLDDVLVRDGP